LLAPAVARDLTYEARGVTLREALAALAERTGYDFGAGDLGPAIEAARKDVSLREAPLAVALKQIGDLWGVDFFSLDYSGFRAIVRRPPEVPPAAAPPYQVTSGPPYGNTQSRSLTLALMFNADTEEQVERIARLGPDLRILDNFGRSLLPPDEAPSRGTTAPRVKLLEYRHRLQITVPDDRAVRIRAVSGSVVLYRRVTPVRLELPLAQLEPVSAARDGLEVGIERVRFDGRNFTARVRLTWPEGVEVAGRGVSRHPLPYLVDTQGRIHREFGPRTTRRSDGDRPGQDQELRFDDLPAAPAFLGYEVWLKSDPGESVAFRLPGIPLPERPSALKPEQRPFYQAEGGGSLSLRVTDRAGRALEGEVTLGLARRGAAGYGPTRWLDVITEPDGTLRLGHLQPGTYRVTRLFRSAPGARAVSDARPPAEVVIAAGREAALPPLRAPLTAPAE